jgi:uncharacterized damage-inducible protein DinB
MAKATQTGLGTKFLQDAEARLKKHHLPQIIKSLESLPDADIWWRPNRASNSVGNLVLHLSGNVRQWIISGIGGSADVRRRDEEFSELGPLPRKGLVALLRSTVNDACRVLAKMPPASLHTTMSRQGYVMTRQAAIMRVIEHFAYHTGQIVYVTKMKTARDLHFTRLPKEKPSRAPRPAPRKARR